MRRPRLRTLVLCALVAIFGAAFVLVGRPYRVVGRSMEPALAQGDWVLLRGGAPRHGDVVVFREPDSGHLAVKRVAGEPGEGVQIVGSDLWVDGETRVRPLASVEDLVPMIEAAGEQIGEHLDFAATGFAATADGWSLAAGEAQVFLHRPPLAHYLLRGELIPGALPAADLGIEVEYRLGSADAELCVDLRVSRASFRARLLAGGALARVERAEPDRPLEILHEQRLDPPAAEGRLFFAAVDRSLTLALDHRPVVTALPFRPPEPASFADRPPDFAHAAHAGLGGRGPMLIRNLRLGRDVQYDPAGTYGCAQVFHLGPDEFFVLGDNPPHSRDSRHYGAVSRASILGVVRARWGGRGWTDRGWQRD